MTIIISAIENEHRKSDPKVAFQFYFFGKILSSLFTSAIKFSGSMVMDFIFAFGFAISKVNVGNAQSQPFNTFPLIPAYGFGFSQRIKVFGM